jgi:hypothetical protein
VNRRDLLKFAALGAVGLLVPSSSVSYFLAPRGGWAQRLKIRRVQQYLIADDSYPIRYDATWDAPDGPKQYHVDFAPIRAEDWVLDMGILRQHDLIARQVLEERMLFDCGTPNSPQFKLALLRGVEFAEYI